MSTMRHNVTTVRPRRILRWVSIIAGGVIAIAMESSAPS